MSKKYSKKIPAQYWVVPYDIRSDLVMCRTAQRARRVLPGVRLHEIVRFDAARTKRVLIRNSRKMTVWEFNDPA